MDLPKNRSKSGGGRACDAAGKYTISEFPNTYTDIAGGSIGGIHSPKGCKNSHLVLSAGIAGKRLAEGDAPALFIIGQDGMESMQRVGRKSEPQSITWRDENICQPKRKEMI